MAVTRTVPLPSEFPNPCTADTVGWCWKAGTCTGELLAASWPPPARCQQLPTASLPCLPPAHLPRCGYRRCLQTWPSVSGRQTRPLWEPLLRMCCPRAVSCCLGSGTWSDLFISFPSLARDVALKSDCTKLQSISCLTNLLVKNRTLQDPHARSILIFSASFQFQPMCCPSEHNKSASFNPFPSLLGNSA